MTQIEWLTIRDFASKPIGALGFVGSKVAVVAAFYDDADGNEDGEVSILERAVFTVSPINLRGKQVVAVAMAARTDLDVLSRDASFATEAVKLYLNFARGLVEDGIYAVYFGRGVKGLSGAVAKRTTDGIVKQFVIRKGMEKAVKAAYDSAMR